MANINRPTPYPAPPGPPAIEFGPGDQPLWEAGYVPSADEWNSWWSFKADTSNPILLGGPYLPLTGGTLVGPLILSTTMPSNTYEAVSKAYVDSLTFANGPFLPINGGTMNGVLVLSNHVPAGPYDAVPKNYADQINTVAQQALTLSQNASAAASQAVPLTGGTMTGALLLSGDPTDPKGAATKSYVDKFVPLSGGTMSGQLVAPTVKLTGAGISFSQNGGGHVNAFSWDGSFVQAFVDGTFTGQLPTVAWLQANYPSYGWLNSNFPYDARYLFKGGDNCTGNLSVNGTVSASYLWSNGDVSMNGNANCFQCRTADGVGYQGSTVIGVWWDGAAYRVDLGANKGNYSYPYSTIDTGSEWRVCGIKASNVNIMWVNASSTGAQYLFWNTTTSDRRRKSNIVPAGDALSLVTATKVYEADYHPSEEADPQHLKFTLLADEVEENVPYASFSPPVEGALLGLNTLHLCATLWRAVQQLDAKLDARK